MDAITQGMSDVAAVAMQPVVLLAGALVAVTLALLLGVAAPLALRIEELRYRMSTRKETKRQLRTAPSGAVRSLHGPSRAGERTRGARVGVR